MTIKGVGRFLEQPLFSIWGLVFIITLIMQAFVPVIKHYDWISLSLIKELPGQYLTVLGMLTAVTIAIMSWIYNQSITSRQKGFSDLRDAVSGLTQNTNDMHLNFTRASPTHQPFLQDWATGTNNIIQRLDEITPGWKGWEESKDLEKKLSKYTDLGITTLKNTGNFLATDMIWTNIFVTNDKHNRNILIGLYWLSTGAMAYIASLRLFQFFISIVILFLFCLIANIVAIAAAKYLIDAYILIVIALTLLLICHVIWLVFIIGIWWQKQRKQEKAWESN